MSARPAEGFPQEGLTSTVRTLLDTLGSLVPGVNLIVLLKSGEIWVGEVATIRTPAGCIGLLLWGQGQLRLFDRADIVSARVPGPHSRRDAADVRSRQSKGLPAAVLPLDVVQACMR